MRTRTPDWRQRWPDRDVQLRPPLSGTKRRHWQSSRNDLKRRTGRPTLYTGCGLHEKRFLGVVTLSWTRRRVLGSLSRTALVLPFTEVLAMTVPPWSRAEAQQTPAAQHEYETKPAAPPQGPASPI